MAKRLFRIDTGINGGELVIGTVNEAFVNHFLDAHLLGGARMVENQTVHPYPNHD